MTLKGLFSNLRRMLRASAAEVVGGGGGSLLARGTRGAGGGRARGQPHACPAPCTAVSALWACLSRRRLPRTSARLPLAPFVSTLAHPPITCPSPSHRIPSFQETQALCAHKTTHTHTYYHTQPHTDNTYTQNHTETHRTITQPHTTTHTYTHKPQNTHTQPHRHTNTHRHTQPHINTHNHT